MHLLKGNANGSADTGIAVMTLTEVSIINHVETLCSGTCTIWCQSDDFFFKLRAEFKNNAIRKLNGY